MNSIGFALDLSSPQGSFCLFYLDSKPQIILHHILPGTFTHSEKLLEELESALHKTGIGFGSIQEWVTTRGPGSFTGLRIAFSTLKAFAAVTQKTFVSVESPEARAQAYLLKMEPSLWPENLLVLSHLTAERYVLTYFDQKAGSLFKIKELVATEANAQAFAQCPVLVDSRIPQKFIQNSKMSCLVNLSSEHLCLAHQMKSRKVYAPTELGSVVPEYFGSSHFD